LRAVFVLAWFSRNLYRPACRMPSINLLV